jgi:hypothetical protein
MNIAIQYGRKSHRPAVIKRRLIVWGSILGVLVIANIVTAFLYSSKTYPRTFMDSRKVGSVGEAELTKPASSGGLHPNELKVVYGEKTTAVKIETLGVNIDPKKVDESVHAGRAWPPLANLIIGQNLTLPVSLQEAQFDKGFATLQQAYEQSNSEGAVVMEDYLFVLKKGTKAIKLDRDAFRKDLIAAAEQGKTTVALRAVPQASTVFEWDAETAWKELYEQQNIGLTYYFTARNKQLTARDIGKWYVPDGKTFKLDEARMRAAIVQVGVELGVDVTNLDQAAAATKEAMHTHQSLAFSFLGGQRQ